jgi:hypothetical protein
MDSPTLVDLIKKNFGFLFDECGFIVAETARDDSAVAIDSPCYRIVFQTDRGQVFISIGNIGGKYIDVTHIISFLTQGPNQINPSYTRGITYDAQLGHIAKFVEPYWEDIFDLFKKENYEKSQNEIHAFLKKRWDESKQGKFFNNASKEFEEKNPEFVADLRRTVEELQLKYKSEQEKKKKLSKK